MNLSESLLNTTEAAKYLGVHPMTLWRWRKLGLGPKYLRVERQIRYMPRDLDEYTDAIREGLGYVA